MIFQKHIPKFPLDHYVDSIIYIEGNNKGTGLPKTAMSLVFNLEDNFKLFVDKSFTNSIDYKKAMLLFYEQNNISPFKQIFIEQFEFAVKTYF